MSPTRRLLLASAGQPIAATVGAAGNPRPLAGTSSDVAHVTRQAALAHEALMRGDIARYRELMPLAADFTLMAPFGGEPSRGGRYTEPQWADIGRFFRDGRDSTVEIVEAYHAADLIVLAAIERTHVAVGDTPPQWWGLRVTLVFRREGECWMLAHRHADPLAGRISVAQSAALARQDG